MKILHGQELVKQLRRLSDSVTKRLWIAVPYIGSPTTVRRILGKKWFDSPSVSVKLLTDLSDLSFLNTETIQHFYDRGQVKTLTGLHAKIYIIDDTCLIASANLTNTAFSKRYEIGVLCNSLQSKQVINTFDIWWKKSDDVKPDKLNKIFSTKRNSKEEHTGASLPTLYDLPSDPGSFIRNLAKNFLQYNRLVTDYDDFAKKYSTIQRIWRKQPLYFEVDGFLDFLYHWDIAPSKAYEKKPPRNLTTIVQKKEIEKWANRFKEWAKNRDNNDWRLDNSSFIREYLAPNRIKTLKENEIRDVLLKTNAGKSREGNCNKVVNENKLADVINALDVLVNAHNLTLPERFSRCNMIVGIGPSIMNELIGFCYPDKYPLINKNSSCGLRFFGYQIKAYK